MKPSMGRKQCKQSTACSVAFAAKREGGFEGSVSNEGAFIVMSFCTAVKGSSCVSGQVTDGTISMRLMRA
eukprot:9794430-Karenia_brevis.AAC.1